MKFRQQGRRIAAAAIAVVAGMVLAGCSGVGGDSSSNGDDKPVVALSNSFIGNSWRKQMVDEFTTAATAAKADGEIADFVVTNADNTVEQQISQINGLILKQVDVILVDAASPTALNGVIDKAVKSGIVVVSFDGTVTSDKSYNLNYDFPGLGSRMVDLVADGIGDKGNVLIVRGLAGTVIDDQAYQGTIDALAKHPGIMVAGTVQGDWDDATAQSAVARLLPTLPQIDAVLVNGGGYGVAQAFEAANRPVPLIYFGNRGYELNWWSEQLKKGPYPSESSSTTPSVSTAAFWLSLKILEGSDVGKDIKMPFLTIGESDLADYADLELDGVASKPYDKAWVEANLISQ
jgi:ribose transport system substrate-binding protein